MKIQKNNILLIIILLLPFILSTNLKNEVVKIEIFYLPWNMKTVDRLYPNDVRNHSRVSKYIIDQKNEIDTLNEILSPVNLRSWGFRKEDIDSRMLIDFHHKSGGTTTYLLNGMHYLSVKIGDTLYRANLDFYNWVNNKLPDPMMKFPAYIKDSIK